MMKARRSWMVVWALLLASLSPTYAQDEPFVQRLDTSRLTGHVKSISDGVLQIETEEGIKQLKLDEVARIHYQSASDVLQSQGKTVVTTVTGMALPANSLQAPLNKNIVKIENTLLGSQNLELAQIDKIYFPRMDISPRGVDQRCKEGMLIREGFDTLVVETEEGRWIGVGGVFQGLSQSEVHFRYKEKDRTADRKNVAAILITHPQQAAEPELRGILFGLKGTKVVFTSIKLSDGQYQVDVPGLGTQKIRASQVSRVQILSDKVVDLVDLAPSKVREKGLFDRTYNYRVNQSVSGKPLLLDQKRYHVGLGLHSFCEMTWPLKGEYEKMVAIVGINDSVRPKGDATVRLLDQQGRDLMEPLRVTGRDKAQLISLDVTGVEQLTLKVDYGEDSLDAADHVDLVAARLIKKGASD
jgi:hypothetical protein